MFRDVTSGFQIPYYYNLLGSLKLIGIGSVHMSSPRQERLMLMVRVTPLSVNMTNEESMSIKRYMYMFPHMDIV